MEQHRAFDAAVEQYETFNNGPYSHAAHVTHVRAVVDAGHSLLRALGEPPARSSNETVLFEAASWALQNLEATDTANAAIHCAPVKYSPLTFRLARALYDCIRHEGVLDSDDLPDHLRRVMQHDGLYQEDPGR